MLISYSTESEIALVLKRIASDELLINILTRSYNIVIIAARLVVSFIVTKLSKFWQNVQFYFPINTYF